MEAKEHKKALLGAMDELIDSNGLRSLRFAEVGVPPPPGACYQKWSRLNVVLEGNVRQCLVKEGREVSVECHAGDGSFYPPYGWNYYTGETWRRTLGLVFRRGYVRFIHNEGVGDGKSRHRDTFFWYHTSHTLSSPGLRALGALRHLALNRGDVETGRHFAVALLRVCREELAGDVVSHMDKAERTFQAALAFLQDHFHESINREETARILGLNPSYLSRLFKERTGETFIHYLWRLRLEHAAELLTANAWTVAEIAPKCGFGDLAHFHRTFKKLYGKTPAAFQRER